jgi:hypothetical protein
MSQIEKNARFLRQCDEIREGAKEYSEAWVKEHYDHLRTNGIKVDAGLYNMLFNAFRAGYYCRDNRESR